MDGGVKIKKLTTLVFAIIILLFISGIGTATTVTLQPGNSIQTAVNNAKAGDIIVLKPGLYTENVKVSSKSSITIKSESGNPDNTEVRSKSLSANVFALSSANYIQINGLKITGAKNPGYSGISLSNCSSCKIQNNKLIDNSRGIYLLNSKKLTISGNTATNDNTYGIVLANAYNSTLSGNKAYSNARGLYIGSSDDNIVIGNTVQDNSVVGFFICGKSDRNTVYNNYFNDINETVKNGIGNKYNTAKTSGTNIIGGPNMGGNFWGSPDGTGFSQKAKDADGDGISDSPYKNISGSIYTDNLPLTSNTGPAPGPVLTADFSGTPVSGNKPLDITFTDKSSGNPTSWSWTFGDGGTSTEKSPKHTYAAGSYTVALKVTNSTGASNTATKTNYINVADSTGSGGSAPVVKFWGSRTSGAAPLTVYFTDNSTNTPTSWNWNFGDNTPVGTVKKPTHIYNAKGTYNVTLTASNAAGSGTLTRTNYITVT